MKHLEKLKEALCEELDKFGKSGDITVNSLDKIHRLTDTIKNIDKIMMLEESEGYSEERGRTHIGGSSYDDDMMYSERRGRGRNAKRDSMGRYSSDGGSYDGNDYSERRTGRGYSRDEATDWMMTRLGEMMSETDDPKQRETLKKCMRELERD